MSARKCKAKSKRTGKRCNANAVTDRDVCYHHGGRTPRGANLPQTKHGRYSKDLPANLAGKYEAAISDQALLELRDELALIDVRLSDLVHSVDAGGASDTWKSLASLASEYKATKDRDAKARTLGTILDTIRRGAADWQRWEDVFRTIERRVRVAESERKRLVEMQQMMTSEQAMVLLTAVVDTVRRHVTDREALRGISTDISAILAAGTSAAN